MAFLNWNKFYSISTLCNVMQSKEREKEKKNIVCNSFCYYFKSTDELFDKIFFLFLCFWLPLLKLFDCIWLSVNIYIYIVPRFLVVFSMFICFVVHLRFSRSKKNNWQLSWFRSRSYFEMHSRCIFHGIHGVKWIWLPYKLW